MRSFHIFLDMRIERKQRSCTGAPELKLMQMCTDQFHIMW